MNHQPVKTSDLARVLRSVHELMHRDFGTPGMALLHGPPGIGKTTALTYTVNAMRGVYVRAKVTWSVTSMLQELCRELHVEAHRHRHPMIEQIIASLSADERPIVLDEADYLFRQRRGMTEMLDALRDIYDTAGVPVVIVGMEDLDKTLRTARLSRFDRRMARIEMRGLTVADTQLVAGTLCEVPVEGALDPTNPDRPVPVEGTLVETLHSKTRGNVGRLVVLLSQLEKWARTNQLDRITLLAAQQRGPMEFTRRAA
ncbi:MAG: ATP-binding protein [Bacteroidota bacterium]